MTSDTNSPTFTSLTPNQKVRERWLKGEWPPVGHPWREVARLPPQESQSAFQGATWQAVSQGLRLLRDQAVSLAMRSGTPHDEVCEARGVASTCEMLLQLDGEISRFHKAMAQENK